MALSNRININKGAWLSWLGRGRAFEVALRCVPHALLQEGKPPEGDNTRFSTPFKSRPRHRPIALVNLLNTQHSLLGTDFWRRGRDLNPRQGFWPCDGLANRCLRPLGHLSA